MKRPPTSQELAEDAKAYAGYPTTEVECIALTFDGMIDDEWAKWGSWNSERSCRLDTQNYLFRPKPESVTRYWSKPEDVPGPVCWLRECSNQKSMGLMVGMGWSGPMISDGVKIGWRNLSDWEYSTDLKTWSKCTVTE